MRVVRDVRSYNYLTSRYLRVRLKDGRIAYVSPAEVAGDGGEEVVGPATGHVLLDGHMVGHLVGLFQYVLAPEGERGWVELFTNPPSAAELGPLFEEKAAGFDLFGDHPAFQDPSAREAKDESSIARLLPTTAGGQTTKRNQDIFLPEIRAMRVEHAMLGLSLINAHSPAGGRGTRTSLAGGGPLRTWVEADPRQPRPFYRTILANLLPKDRFDALGARDDGVPVLPWMGAINGTRTSANTPPEHLYFACPRRILLAKPVAPSPERACEITGERDVPLIETMYQLANGPDYESTGWRHPLTPYVYRKDKGQMQSYPKLAATLASGAGWRERVGLLADRGGAATEGPVAAQVVALWRDRRLHRVRRSGGEASSLLRVRAFGMRCDNAKVTSLVDTAFTFRVAPSEELEKPFDDYANRLVEAGTHFARLLVGAAKEAEYSDSARKQLPKDYGVDIQAEFWRRTQRDFDAHLDAVGKFLAEGGGFDDERVIAQMRIFLEALRRAAHDIFDDRFFARLDGPNAERVARARQRLRNFTHKHIKDTAGDAGKQKEAAE